MSTQDKTICVIDRGLFPSLAMNLVKDFKKVYYHRQAQRSDPDVRDICHGKGYDFEPIDNLDDYEDKIDVFCFCYLYTGSIQRRLRKDKRQVWGPGSGEDLELYRWETGEIMVEAGLPINRRDLIKGMTNLRLFLKEHENKWVKVSYVRGLRETWKHKTYDESREILDSLTHDLGGMQEEQEFIVEDPIDDALESGYDGFNIDGEFPDQSLFGVEIKDSAYVQTFRKYDDLPEQVRTVNTRLSPYMLDMGYRGFFFTELRNDILTDVTARMASPAGETVQKLWSNLGEIIEGGSRGKLIEPKKAANFAAQVMLTCEDAAKMWRAVKCPKDVRPWVNLYDCTRIGGVEYVVPRYPPDAIIGNVVGTGDTLEAAIEACREHAQAVIDSNGDIKAKLDVLDEATEEFEKANAQ